LLQDPGQAKIKVIIQKFNYLIFGNLTGTESFYLDTHGAGKADGIAELNLTFLSQPGGLDSTSILEKNTKFNSYKKVKGFKKK
jgi:hypothetical protein